MKKNMAVVDRLLRLIIALGMIISFFTVNLSSPWSYMVLGVGLIFSVTAYLGVCPLYSLFGIDTRQFKEGKQTM